MNIKQFWLTWMHHLKSNPQLKDTERGVLIKFSLWIIPCHYRATELEISADLWNSEVPQKALFQTT